MAEPLRATFFALRKRDRAVLLPATIVFAIVVALLVAAFLALNWRTISGFNEFAQMAAAQESGTADPDVAASFVFGMFGLFGSALLFMFPLYVTIAAYEAACLRWMIRGEAPGLFGLTLNNDTWRVYGVYWVWFAVQMVLSIALSIVLMPIMFAEMMELARQSTPDPDAIWRAQVKMQLLSLLQYVPLIFLGIRLGPAAATSIGRRRFSFFEAWSVTSDRFFALLGSYAVVTIPLVLLWAALWIGTMFLQLGSWEEIVAIWTRAPTPEQSQEMMRAAFTLQAMTLAAVSWGVFLLLWLFWLLLTYGINACAVLAALDEGKTSVDPAD